MRELPIADCFKELYEKENKTFTDSERATIFWNMDLPISEKLAALKEIHDMTTDEVLKKQIKARLDREAEIEEAFMSRDKDYIQLVFLDDSDDADSHHCRQALFLGKRTVSFTWYNPCGESVCCLFNQSDSFIRSNPRNSCLQ